MIAKKISQGLLTFPKEDKDEEKKLRLDGLLFNAGGLGHDTSGKPTGPNQILDMYQINILGHIHLLEALLEITRTQKAQSSCQHQQHATDFQLAVLVAD